ncbi:MAG: methyltransferase domain-containing protein [Snowella sp.]|nr:methyltransferase domain-containing protein [Snowella sp.]
MIKHQLDQTVFVDRVNYIQDICRGKKVLHLGATDAPETINAVKQNRLLHLKLKEVSASLMGLDINNEMIEWLSKNHQINNIQHGNIENPGDYPQEDFDVVVAGEVFEHLSNQGKALDAIRENIQSTTKLVITVPNAYSLKGFVRAMGKHEFIHPDHTLHHSPYTLKSLLERHGFVVESDFSYVNGGRGLAANIANSFLKFSPQLAEGIGVVCRLK